MQELNGLFRVELLARINVYADELLRRICVNADMRFDNEYESRDAGNRVFLEFNYVRKANFSHSNDLW